MEVPSRSQNWRTNGRGSASAMVVEIDMGTCPAKAGRPSGRKSLRRRDIQRRDALLQVPNHCVDYHLTRSKGTSESRGLSPGLWRFELRPFRTGEANRPSAGPLGAIKSDPNRRGSPGGSPYHGFVKPACNPLNISHIGRARLPPSRGGPKPGPFRSGEANRPSAGPRHKRQDAAATWVVYSGG